MTKPPPDLPSATDAPLDAAATSERLTAGAMQHWEPLAAAAWRAFTEHGRGILLLTEAELTTTAAAPRATYLPLTHIPRGDDFRPLIAGYDPAREILVCVQTESGEDLLLAVAADGAARPRPEACAQRRDDTP